LPLTLAGRLQLRSQPAEVNSVEEEVFRQSFIPRTLDEVLEPERDVRKVAAGDTKDVGTQTSLSPCLPFSRSVPFSLRDHLPQILYTKITGLKADLTGGARSSEAPPAAPATTPTPVSTKPRPPGKPVLPSEPSAGPVAAPSAPVASPIKKASEASPQDGASDSEEEDDDEDGSSGDEEGAGDGQGKPAAEATPLDKKAWKKKVKEENREKRKNKIPKHLKKQKIKNTSTKKKR
jgi:RIO kinase 1